MKKLHFIAQSKGGVGKSLLMYLMALKNHHKENCLFVDMDASTFTSRRQLSFVDEDKLDTVSLLNERAAIQRDNLFVYLDKLSRSRYQEIYVDLGAPESEQLPALIEFDDVQLPLREFADDMDIEFHIVIGGAGAYNASVEYLLKMVKVIADDFEITVWESVTGFRKFSDLARELAENCESMGLTFRKFGDFEPETYVGSGILSGVSKGLALENYDRGPRKRFERELSINFGYE
jgi:hypothetical protein